MTAAASATAPDSVDASGNPVSYPVSNVVDGNEQTAWRAVGDGHGVTVTLTLPSAAHLTEVGLIPGYAKLDPPTASIASTRSGASPRSAGGSTTDPPWSSGSTTSRPYSTPRST